MTTPPAILEALMSTGYASGVHPSHFRDLAELLELDPNIGPTTRYIDDIGRPMLDALQVVTDIIATRYPGLTQPARHGGRSCTTAPPAPNRGAFTGFTPGHYGAEPTAEDLAMLARHDRSDDAA